MKIHKGAVLLTSGVEELKKRLEVLSIPVTETGCWLWLGHLNDSGYGLVWVDGKNCRAHRISVEVYKGRFRKKLKVCHKCDTPMCINPDHLFVGTQKVNLEDMIAKRRHWRHKQTHCKYGHEFTPENIHYYRGNRICKKCANKRDRYEYYRTDEKKAKERARYIKRTTPLVNV